MTIKLHAPMRAAGAAVALVMSLILAMDGVTPLPIIRVAAGMAAIAASQPALTPLTNAAHGQALVAKTPMLVKIQVVAIATGTHPTSVTDGVMHPQIIQGVSGMAVIAVNQRVPMEPTRAVL